MKDRKEQAYITPCMEVITIEVEQSILAASIEEIGDTLEDLDW
jgi:hypothetical protein